MEEILIYLLKSAVLLSLFWLVYVIFLKKDTTFSANRKFLLGGILSVGILPAVTFTRRIWKEPASTYSPVNFTETPATEATSLFNLWEVAGLFYFLVCFFLLVKLGLKLFLVMKLISAHTVEKKEGLYFIKTKADFTPFSFFSYIFYNPNLHSKEELELILCHEKVHVRQRHSVDILFANLTTALLWFNPLSWLYKKNIEHNLEFIADKEAVAASGEKTAYQKALVKITAGGFPPALTNQFYQSLIKKRILMLNENHNSKQNKWKTMLIFPLILAFMLSFNVKTEARILSSEQKTSGNVTNEADQQILEAHFSENTTKNDLEIYKKTFAENGIKLEWKNIEFIEEKLKKLRLRYTLENGEAEEFISETDEKGKFVPFKLRMVIQKDGKVATIDILAASIRETEKKRLIVNKIKEKETVGLPQNMIYIIDEQKVRKSQVDQLDPNEILSINVLKNEKAIEAAGEKGKNGVILIKTKKETKQQKDARQDVIESKNPNQNNFSKDPQPLVVVEGEVKNMEYLKTTIEPKDIKSMNVIKGPAAIEKYGERAAEGAIEVLLIE